MTWESIARANVFYRFGFFSHVMGRDAGDQALDLRAVSQ